MTLDEEYYQWVVSLKMRGCTLLKMVKEHHLIALFVTVILVFVSLVTSFSILVTVYKTVVVKKLTDVNDRKRLTTRQGGREIGREGYSFYTS